MKKIFGQSQQQTQAQQQQSGRRDQQNISPNPLRPSATPKPGPDDEKVNQLRQMFENLDVTTIRKCLGDANGNVEQAIDALLNVSLISESPSMQTIPTFVRAPQTQPPRPAQSQAPPPQATTPAQQALRQSPPAQVPSATRTSQVAFSETNSIDSQLLQASKDGNIEMVKYFVREIKPHLTRNIRPLMHKSLILAIEGGHLNVIKVLLENGSPVDGIENESTPLLVAIEAKRADCALLLINSKADVNKSPNSTSPLHLAVKYSLFDVVKALLEKKAHVNRVDTQNGYTPLHWAVHNMNFDIVSKLLTNGAELLLRDNANGETPLHMAMRLGKTSHEIMILCLLLDKTTPQAINLPVAKTGNTILHIAVERFVASSLPQSIVETIVKYKPDKSIRNVKGKTPFDLAKEAHKPVPQKLLELLANGAVGLPDEEIPLSDSRSRQATRNSLQSRSFRQPTASTLATTGKLRREKDPDWKLVHDFRLKIESLLDDNGFETEYNEIEELTKNDNLTGNFSTALSPVCMNKNRYKNILAYEHTRVKLTPVDNIEGTDYINANYVDGEAPGSEKLYIATQGPLAHTCGDFWRMVWEQKAKVIVMLANEIENGKQKVYPYWPDTVPFQFGYLTVSLMSSKTEHQVVQREIKVENTETGTSRVVVHLQYIGWPDQGLPDNTTGFTHLIDLVNVINTDNSKIIVHCSAGIGRTGTFCIVHTTLAKLNLLMTSSIKVTFDLKQTLLKMRKQRAGMVQTAEQYVFCYLSLIDRLTDILQIIDYKNSAWFHKNLAATDVTKLLTGKRPGTYLFRPSSEPGCIAINAVHNSSIVHSRVTVSSKGFTIDNDTFDSLVALVESRRHLLTEPLMCE